MPDFTTIYDSLALVVCCFITFVCVFGILRYFTKKSRFSWGIYIALFCHLSILLYSLLLLTIDLSSGLYETRDSKETGQPQQQPKTPPKYLIVFWRIVYWTIQVMAWFAIPLSQTYVYNGEFTFLRRLVASALENAIMYIIMATVGGFALGGLIIYIVISNKHSDTKINLNFSMLLGIGQSLSASFGLLLMISLLGYGIVDFPRYMWQQANVERSLTFIEFQAIKMEDTVSENESVLKEVLGEVKAFDEKVTSDNPLRRYVDQMVKTCEREFENFRIRASTQIRAEDVAQLKRSQLAKLHKTVKKAIAKYYRSEYNWQYLQERAFILEDIIDSTHNSTEKKIKSPFRKERTKFWSHLLDKPEWIWYRYVRWIVFRSIAILFIPFALVLVYCEFTPLFVFLMPKKDKQLSVFYYLIHSLVKYRPLLQITSLLIIVMIAMIILFALFRIEIYSLYQLIPHHTDAGSIIYTAIFMGRVCPTLCYNFLQMLGVTSQDSVAFYQIMGPLKLDGLKEIGSKLVSKPTIIDIVGGGFVNFFPMLMIVISILTLLNIPSYIGVLFNIPRFNFNPKIIDKDIQEGREILQKARRRRISQMERDSKDELDSQLMELQASTEVV